MKKFVFSLEKVLSFKGQMLDVKKNELANLQMQLRQVEQKIENLNNEFALNNQKMVLEMQNGLTPKDIEIYKIYFNSVNQNLKKLAVEKMQLLNLIEQKKQEIIELNSEISGLERLKEKQLDLYFKATRKAEELAIEEFVSQGH
ncbi:MAG TPA: flagellar FliJ family protein [Oscillospiraceae bacterium]|nr:flagellar FliJ family protein [Oscillospiraceae bacterium]